MCCILRAKPERQCVNRGLVIDQVRYLLDRMKCWMPKLLWQWDVLKSPNTQPALFPGADDCKCADAGMKQGYAVRRMVRETRKLNGSWDSIVQIY